MRLLTVPTLLIRLPLEVAKTAGGIAVDAAKGAYGVVAGGDESPPPADFAARARPAARPESGNGTARDPRAEAAAAAERWRDHAVEVEPEPEPVHVGEEPELVAEVAEEGAEQGAGAEVTIEEPWPGYDQMTAADIRDRLVSEEETVVAAVRLYEASRKGRASVLEATSRA